MGFSLEKEGHHEWLVKSNFSFLMGASHPHELLERAASLGYLSLCLNDFDGVYGLARAHLDLKEKIEEELTLHHGVEIHLQQDHERPILLQDTLVLVALNAPGYHNLCCLITWSHRENKDKAFVSLEDLSSFDLSHLAAIRPMRGSIREKQQDHALPLLKELFPDRLYLAVGRHLHPAEDCWINKRLLEGKKYELPFLLSQDVFFHQRERKNLSDMLHAIRTNNIISHAQKHFFPNGERHLHCLRQLDFLFHKLPIYESAIKSSRDLAEKIDFSFDELRYKYPGEMIPEGFTSFEYLEKVVIEGMNRRLGKKFDAALKEKLYHELAVVEKLQFSDYFLTVWDIVRWARSQDILCQGRGSAANSIICFALEITSIDPNQFELLFERFISEERGDPPDIDVDFEHERREEVIQYIYERYGRARAAMVANIITYKQKGSMRAVGKALGVSEHLLSRASKLQRTRLLRGKGNDFLISKIRSEWEEMELQVSWEHWTHFSNLLKGFPRHMGIHSGGFVIAGKDLDHLVPQEPATMEGRTVIQWCKDDIEGLGFFKIDVLALGMLTALRKCFHEVEEKYGRRLGLYEIPEDDPKTYAMIQKADTVGTFQIESRAQMTMLPRLKPKCLYDLVVEVAIIRPGPIQGKVIHPYLRRRDGLEPVTYPDPCLKPILERTLGIAIFQEQAMRIAVEVGDFTPGEADELRRNIGSWNVRNFEQALAPWLVKLETGMRKKGYGDDFVEQILGQMQGFSDYGFPESHAISFALIAYASSYLKCHYPAAFFASVLNSQPMGFYSPHNLLQAARHDGVTILPPSVNHSDWDHKLEKDKGRWAIRIGFRLVNNLSQSAANSIVLRREERGPWKNFDDFLGDRLLFRDDLGSLAAANAFECLGLDRAGALWMAEAVPFRPLIDATEKKYQWKEESRMESVLKDFRAFNTSVKDHPVRIIRQEAWSYPLALKELVMADKLPLITEEKDVNVFGMVRVKQSPPTANGMVFVTLEDETGFINLVLHPYKYAAFSDMVENHNFLCANGRLQMAGDYRSIMVNFFYPIREFKAEVTNIRRAQKKEDKALPTPRHYY